MSETPTTKGVIVTPLESFLARLRMTSETLNPHVGHEDPALGLAFVKIAHGYVEYIEAARKEGGPGYEQARSALFRLAEILPLTEDNSFENIVHALRVREG